MAEQNAIKQSNETLTINTDIEKENLSDINIVENIEPTVSTVIENESNDVSNESEWQKPISLKALKKKLNETFIVK